MSLENEIKEMAHNVAEQYLLFGRPLNETIMNKYNNGDIENKAILKRVCELANQNVYLSLFSKAEDKSNIKFDYADYDTIVSNINNMENGMNSYNDTPSDFRSSLMDFGDITPSVDEESEKIASLHVRNDYSNSLQSFINNLTTVKHSLVKEAEESYIAIKNNIKNMSHYGETFDDMYKMARDYIVDEGMDFTKTAAAFNLSRTELEESGYTINDGLTKKASMTINGDSEYFKPIHKFAEATASIEAVDEIIANISNIKRMIDNV